MTRTGEYQQADPAAAGLDPVKLKAAMDYANLSNPLTMKVFRHGCLLAQGPATRCSTGCRRTTGARRRRSPR